MSKIPITTELAQKNKVVSKVTTVQVGNGTNVNIPELEFTGLTPGSVYKISGITHVVTSGNVAVFFDGVHDGNAILANIYDPETTSPVRLQYGTGDVYFTATATTLTFRVTAPLAGSGIDPGTRINLEECRDKELVSDFT
jgi:hypothetical protein